jgi:polyhydroxyalkanoate synthesis regulator phasin/RecA/RadA recombinase
MHTEFKNGLEVLREHQATPKLTTGLLDLDSLLAGGVELGSFSLFYGDNESILDSILYRLLCNCQLPKERNGFQGKALLVNCGNYRQEQVLLDLKLTTNLLRASGIDPATGLDRIIAVSAFNADQAAQSVEEVSTILQTDHQVKLVVVRNLPKLFIEAGSRNELALDGIRQLQHLIARMWQTCAEKNVALVASCRPRRPNSLRLSPPEGGVFLRHLVQVMVGFKKKEESGRIVACLLKHPKRQLRTVEFVLNRGDSIMGRLTIPFRSQLQQEIENLSRSFKEALMEPARRDAFDSLARTWTAEQGAMSYAKVPSPLEVMLLTAAVDNRKNIEELEDRISELRSQLDQLRSELDEAKIASKTLTGAP